ncbi:hypothetical protein [Streptomyces filamentosus]|uniref:hypothetical protein n=1 Tax=Streptomyces filamentosus TaxID=67294 RepID=UPI0033F1F533
MSWRKEAKLERVPRPALNGDQMACVKARFAQEETPALAHFAAVHHHLGQILRTVAVEDRRDWILRNIARAQADLNTLEMAVQAGDLPLDLTERDIPTRLRKAFEGIPAGLRQPLDASRGRRDFSVAHRPVQGRQEVQDLLSLLKAIGVVIFAIWFFS